MLVALGGRCTVANVMFCALDPVDDDTDERFAVRDCDSLNVNSGCVRSTMMRTLRGDAGRTSNGKCAAAVAMAGAVLVADGGCVMTLR